MGCGTCHGGGGSKYECEVKFKFTLEGPPPAKSAQVEPNTPSSTTPVTDSTCGTGGSQSSSSDVEATTAAGQPVADSVAESADVAVVVADEVEAERRRQERATLVLWTAAWEASRSAALRNGLTAAPGEDERAWQAVVLAGRQHGLAVALGSGWTEKDACSALRMYCEFIGCDVDIRGACFRRALLEQAPFSTSDLLITQRALLREAGFGQEEAEATRAFCDGYNAWRGEMSASEAAAAAEEAVSGRRQQEDAWRRSFREWDRDRDGFISVADMHATLQMQAAADETLPYDESLWIVICNDEDGDGRLDFREFLVWQRGTAAENHNRERVAELNALLQVIQPTVLEAPSTAPDLALTRSAAEVRFALECMLKDASNTDSQVLAQTLEEAAALGINLSELLTAARQARLAAQRASPERQSIYRPFTPGKWDGSHTGTGAPIA
eukprot:gnl/TRDRNA2_/TRDRNA2_61774_c0_seq2.p1 gnl/TRDRNA2_/TRDRNA2_61774_c0~~gnl/TRDRNA2_/TRDRNA2_61774_c0_seq2.p1  ORF type:complete len:453 (+),score=89.72 gnl/TRDRNA2_/TRDRNA2_61774_c0_seq2:37-1359(+)